jgi:hypothetical protein
MSGLGGDIRYHVRGVLWSDWRPDAFARMTSTVVLVFFCLNAISLTLLTPPRPP